MLSSTLVEDEEVCGEVGPEDLWEVVGLTDAIEGFDEVVGVVEDGAGQDQRFWRLADALSALYPPGSEEKRWVDGVLARKKGLGF